MEEDLLDGQSILSQMRSFVTEGMLIERQAVYQHRRTGKAGK